MAVTEADFEHVRGLTARYEEAERTTETRRQELYAGVASLVDGGARMSEVAHRLGVTRAWVRYACAQAKAPATP